MPNATIGENFQKLLEKSCGDSEKIGTYLAEMMVSRDWMGPPTWDGDVFDFGAIHEAFERKGQNEQYMELMVAAGAGLADTMPQKLQIDYIAMMERAFLARHSSPVRAMMHAAARRKGHGHAGGVHIGGVLQYAQDLLASAKSTLTADAN
jgi:hypothetical protein